MEQDKIGAKRVEEDEMDTAGHGDKLQSSVDKVAEPSEERPESSTQVDEEDMDTTGHGDPKRRLLSTET